MVVELYSGFTGKPLHNPLQTGGYYSSHASFEPKSYAQAISEFKRQFIASAIEYLSHSRVVSYRNLASLLDESRHVEKQVEENGLKPFMRHYYTETASRGELSPQDLADYTPWKTSLDSRVIDAKDVFEHPNINPSIRVSSMAAKIIKEAKQTGNYNLRDATERFRALYVASVVKRMAEGKYTRTLTKPKVQAARYLKVSTRTIDRMLEEAIKFGYAKIEKIKEPDTNYSYELINLQEPTKAPDARIENSGIEQKLDKRAA